MTEETVEQTPKKNKGLRKMLLIGALGLVIVASAAVFVFQTYQGHGPVTSNADSTASDTLNAGQELSNIPSDSTYYVITGVFHREHNIKRCVDKMTTAGYNAELLPGIDATATRISVGQFPSRNEAETFLQSVQSSVAFDAWVLAQIN